MQSKEIKAFQRKLLYWYQKNARDLPWRRTKDPYKIWVSEIMLQQTQVATVIPYYKRWMKRFPTLKAFAKAPLSEAMKHWAGLGYYRRVRMLHEGVRKIVEESKGRMPTTVEELQKLPGIGRYTAGAIASIAFDQKVPILDGNVIRILTRLFAIQDDIGSPKTIQQLWKLSEKLVGAGLPRPCGPKNIGDFNQAMMELGATICAPEKPACLLCPVASLCIAHQKQKETRFPAKKKRDRSEKIKTAALLLRKNGKVLVEKQPKEGRWGGLWMFPHWRDKKSMMRCINVGAGSPSPGEETSPLHLKRLITIKHGFTKYRIELEVYEANADAISESLMSSPRPFDRLRVVSEVEPRRGSMLSATNSSDACLPVRQRPAAKFGGDSRFRGNDKSLHSQRRWISLKNLPDYPFPSPHQKIVDHLLK